MLALALAFGTACGGDADVDLGIPDERRARERADLDWLIESGLQSELPPPMQREEQEFYEVKLHRRQIADKIAARTESALAPLAVAAAVFAPQGAADLVLSVFPVHRLGEAAEFARKAWMLRATNKRSRRLITLHKQFETELSDDARAFFQLAQKLRRAERRALETLAQHTGSPSVVSTLMARHLRGEADVVWLASKLKRKHIDKDFVRRFTFDGDFVKEFSTYDAHPSWSVLKDVVVGRTVADGKRNSLMYKLHGLLGERAAADMLQGPVLAARYFKSTSRVLIGRGVSYRTLRGREGSIDIMARCDGKVLFAEVKNLAAKSWSEAGQARILAQLKRHNRGIEAITARSNEPGTVTGKVLMVAEKGYDEGMRGDRQKTFAEALEKLGWTLELIPARRIPSGDAVINSLK